MFWRRVLRPDCGAQVIASTETPAGPLVQFSSIPRLICVAIFFVGLHTRLTLYHNTQVVLPMYISLFSSVIFLYLYRSQLSRDVLSITMLLFVFLTADAVYTYGTTGVIIKQLLGGVHLLASIFLCIGFYYVLRSTRPAALARICFLMWLVCITAAVLEISTGFRQYVVSVVDYLYADTPRVIYEAVDRDISIYGHVRPLVFASEPSFLAITLSMLLLIVFFCDLRRRPIYSFSRAVVMLAVSHLVAPSLTYGFTAIIVAIWLFQRLPISTRAVIVGSAVPLAIALFWAVGGANPLYAEMIDHSQTGSFFGRVIAPPLSTIKVLSSYPLFGLGVGNEDSAYPMIFAAWSETGAFSRFWWFAGDSAADLITNPIWWHWIYFGLVGGVVFIVLICKLLDALGVQDRFLVICSTAIFWLAGVGYVDLVSWSIFYLFAFASGAVSSVALEAKKQAPADSYAHERTGRFVAIPPYHAAPP